MTNTPEQPADLPDPADAGQAVPDEENPASFDPDADDADLDSGEDLEDEGGDDADVDNSATEITEGPEDGGQ